MASETSESLQKEITRRQANAYAREQFAALGQFVQAFEVVVANLRRDCGQITRGSKRGITMDGRSITTITQWRISELIFSHNVMTAQPLLILWRALLYEATLAILDLSEEGRTIALAVATQIAGDFTKVIECRNDIIHATWQIGHPFSWEDPTRIMVGKTAVTAKGLTAKDSLPTSAGELYVLTRSCYGINNMLGGLLQYLYWEPQNIGKVFVKRKASAELAERWLFTPVISKPASKPRSSRG